MALSPLDIRKALLDVGVSQASIARTLSVTRQTVNQVVLGERSTPTVRRAISNALGMTYLRVWGTTDPETAAQTPTGTASLPDTSSNVARGAA